MGIKLTSMQQAVSIPASSGELEGAWPPPGFHGHQPGFGELIGQFSWVVVWAAVQPPLISQNLFHFLPEDRLLEWRQAEEPPPAATSISGPSRSPEHSQDRLLSGTSGPRCSSSALSKAWGFTCLIVCTEAQSPDSCTGSLRRVVNVSPYRLRPLQRPLPQRVWLCSYIFFSSD